MVGVGATAEGGGMVASGGAMPLGMTAWPGAATSPQKQSNEAVMAGPSRKEAVSSGFIGRPAPELKFFAWPVVLIQEKSEPQISRIPRIKAGIRTWKSDRDLW
jgi:hypothetical protein